MKKPHRYTLNNISWVLPTFPIYVYPTLAPSVPPLNVVWIWPCYMSHSQVARELPLNRSYLIIISLMQLLK